MSKNRNKYNWDNSNLLIAIIIVIVIIVFLISLGKINWSSTIDKSQGKSKDDIQRRHDILKALVDKQKALKEKLAKRFRWIYFFIRLVFVGIWTVITLFIKWELINELGDFLNYSQAFFIGLVVMNFLTFGNLANLKSFLDNIKNRVENRVWGKYINIDNKISANVLEINSLSNQIEKFK